MSAVKITDMTAGSALDGTELLEMVQGGATKSTTAAQVKTLARKNTNTAISSASGVLNIDLSLGDYFNVTLTENVTSLTFSNLDGASYGRTVMLQITQHASAAKTFAWPASFKWSGGVAGVVSATLSAVDVLAVTTFNNGTAWRATLANGFA